MDSAALYWGAFARKSCVAFIYMLWTVIASGSAVAQEMDALHLEVLSHLQRGEVGPAREKAQKYLSWLNETAGKPDIRFSDAFNDLAIVSMMAGNYTEAEISAKRALEIAESANPPDELRYAAAVATLSGIYGMQGRVDEARALSARSTSLFGKAGTDEEELFAALARVANLDASDPVQFVEVEATHKKAIAYFEQHLEENDKALIGMLTALASLYVLHNRCADAEPLLARAARAQEQNDAFGPFERATTSQSIADCLAKRGVTTEAEAAYRKVLFFYEHYFGKDSIFAAQSLAGLAKLTMGTGRSVESLDFARRAAAIQLRQLGRETPDARSRSHADTGRFAFDLVTETAWRAAVGADSDREPLLAEAFQAAQLSGRTRAGDAFGQLNARLDAGNGDIAVRIRENQDLRRRWQAADRELVQLMVAGADASNVRSVRKRMSGLEHDIAASESIVAGLSPSYSALIGLETLAPDDVMRLLAPDEALLVLSVNENETFIWFLTETDSRWLRRDLGAKALSERVGALRCGLDRAAWSGAGSERCASLLGLASGGSAPHALPFDVTNAHELYKTLFAGAEDLIRNADGTGKHLLVVPSGSLAQLPFQVLVTEPPTDRARTSWLMRRHAVSVLPSVASLKALRNHPRSTTDRRQYAAFANPLLNGNAESEEDKAGASVARLMADCAITAKVAPFLSKTGNYMGDVGARIGTKDNLWLETLRRWKPVPHTAVLACDVAKAMKAGEDDIYLGPRATESNIKAMSSSGALATYAVVNFATHGAIAGEVSPNAEPGLVLTPPDAATDENDGYLSASEVAGLKLDADWVILSACNTAAGGAKEVEALSGLARAFFYAGARTMLVSHWSVREDAAVALTVGALSATAADRRLGRAGAMQQAMISLADSDDPIMAHPTHWAPFVVVGEGGVAR